MKWEPDWRKLLPGEPYHFQLGLSAGNAAQFFEPTEDHEALAAERRRCLGEAADEHCGLEVDGVGLLGETLELAKGWGCSGFVTAPESTRFDRCSALEQCRALGEEWEPDFLLLHRGVDQRFRLVGGAVCFPSAWSLPEKMGRTVAEIHGVVPTLNPTLGAKIDTFLNRMAPGTAWERTNWGLSHGPELNRHPRFGRPALEAATPIERIFVRVEHQVFFRLPRTGGLLFGIRLSIHPLLGMLDRPDVSGGMRWALETMPAEVAAYKGVSQVRDHVVRLLGGHEAEKR